MGLLARPSTQAPIDTSGIFLAHMSGRESKIWKFFQSIFFPIQGILSTFRFFLKNPKKSNPQGAGGATKFLFFLTPILFFCDLKLHAKLQNPTITPSGRKVNVGQRRKQKRR